MKRRPNQFKIPDIKVVRSLTRLLGKLQIPSCYRYAPDEIGVFDADGKYMGVAKTIKQVHGWGLKESKDYVESKYDYYLPAQETEADKLSGQRLIHEIKRTRQLMQMLDKLGIKSADSGLAACRGFVTRQRN